MGAIAVVELQDYIMQALSRRGLQSPTSLIRLMIQQSVYVNVQGGSAEGWVKKVLLSRH